jgi:hypothetical protein
MTRKQVLWGAVALTGAIVVAAGFIPFDKSPEQVRSDIKRACEAHYIDLGQGAVVECQLRHTVQMIEDDRANRDKAVSAAVN